jgi:hypothetical protein
VKKQPRSTKAVDNMQMLIDNVVHESDGRGTATEPGTGRGGGGPYSRGNFERHALSSIVIFFSVDCDMYSIMEVQVFT